MQLIWCSCRLMNVSVSACMCLYIRACEQQLKKCSGENFGRKLSTILVTVLCFFAVPAF